MKSGLTKINILVDGEVVGQVKNLDINQTRSGQPIQLADSTGTILERGKQGISGSASRVRFDNAKVAEVFSKGMVHRSTQRLPFDIHIVNDSGNKVIRNAWINEFSFTYGTSDWQIVDHFTWEAEDFILSASSAVLRDGHDYPTDEPISEKVEIGMIGEDIVRLGMETVIQHAGAVVGKVKSLELTQKRANIGAPITIEGNCLSVEIDREYVEKMFESGIIDGMHQKEDFDLKITERFAKAGRSLRTVHFVRGIKITEPYDKGLDGIGLSRKLHKRPKISWTADIVERCQYEERK